MKRIIRLSSLLLAACMLLALTACGTNLKEKNADRSLLDHGLDLVAMLKEMADSETYFELHSTSSELQEILSSVRNADYTKPDAVYRIEISENAFFGAPDAGSLTGLSDTLKEFLSSKLQSSIISQINAQGGATVLAVASVCTAGKAFVNDAFSGNMIYLYVYEDTAPVIVSFVAGEGGAVSATGSFILYDGFAAGSREDVERSFSDMGISAKVTQTEQ